MSAEWERARPWIVCAAIKRVSDGSIIAGARHFDEIMVNAIKGFGSRANLDTSWRDAEQGFIDQFGRFYDREQAMTIARSNGQLRAETGAAHLLYSEDLY